MENQQLEWKETWRDEYLKWICGFANAQGGTLVIGKNDKNYDNRVTIANDCHLPEGTTLSGLMNAHKSVSINPLVASAIFRSGQIEAWGRGIERIIRQSVADNLPEPEFIITPRTFTICFSIRNNQKDDPINEDNGEINCGVKDGINCGVKDGTNCSVNEIQHRIITILLESPNIKVQEIANKMNISKRSIEYNIKALKDNGFIERIGSDRAGHWQIIKQS